jgi:hypothetical protein
MTAREGLHRLADVLRLRRHVARATSALTEAVPEVSGSDVPSGWRLPEGFDCTRYPGLLHAHVVRRSGGPSDLLLTFWRSHHHRDLQGPALVAALSISAATLTGPVAQSVSRSAAWRSPGDIVLRVGAIIGALSVAWALFAAWLIPPDVNAALDVTQPVNARTREIFPLKVVLTNQSLFSTARVRLHLPAEQNGTSVSTAYPTVIVPAAQRTEAVLTGLAGRPGALQLTMEVESRAGIFSSTTQVPMSVVVWQASQVQQGTAVEASPCSDSLCTARGILDVARTEARGYACSARLVGLPDVHLSAVTSVANGGETEETGKGQRFVSMIRWDQPAPTEFRHVPLEIAVTGTPPRGMGWRDVMSRIEWICRTAGG